MLNTKTISIYQMKNIPEQKGWAIIYRVSREAAYDFVFAFFFAARSDNDMDMEAKRKQRRSRRASGVGFLLHGSESDSLRAWLVALVLQQLSLLGLHIHVAFD